MSIAWFIDMKQNCNHFCFIIITLAALLRLLEIMFGAQKKSWWTNELCFQIYASATQTNVIYNLWNIGIMPIFKKNPNLLVMGHRLFQNNECINSKRLKICLIFLFIVLYDKSAMFLTFYEKSVYQSKNSVYFSVR